MNRPDPKRRERLGSLSQDLRLEVVIGGSLTLGTICCSGVGVRHRSQDELRSRPQPVHG